MRSENWATVTLESCAETEPRDDLLKKYPSYFRDPVDIMGKVQSTWKVPLGVSKYLHFLWEGIWVKSKCQSYLVGDRFGGFWKQRQRL